VVTAPGEDRVLTVPNLLSIARLLCAPVFVWLLFGTPHPHRVAAAALLAVLGVTDCVDGYVARHFDQISNLGKVLDPVADRVLLGVGVVSIMVDGSAPLWFGLAVVAREALISAAVLVLAARRARRIDVTLVGKAGTLCLMVAFPLFLVSHDPGVSFRAAVRWLAWAVGMAGLGLAWYSVVLYVPLARRAMQGRVGSGAAVGPPVNPAGVQEVPR
jgi:cardiolipin synthase